MGLSFYYIPVPQTPAPLPPLAMAHLSTIKPATIWSLELGNIKSL